MVGKWTDMPPRPNQPKQEDCLLTQMLEEQRKTNQILLMLVEAMAQEEADPDDEPSIYMDGSRVS